MIAALVLSLLVLMIPSTLLVHCLWPNSLKASLPIKIFLGVGLGFGISSVLLFLWLITVGSLSRGYRGYPAVEMLIALSSVAVLVYVIKRRGVQPASSPPVIRETGSKLTNLTGVSLLISVACIAITMLVISLREPHGQGDATAIWNLIARFIYRGGRQWTNTLSSHLAWTHADYPLLLPTSVARLWAYAGETQFGPILIAMLFTFCTLGLLVSSTSILRTRTQGYLAGLVLLEPFLFFRIGTYQYADILLGFFLLAALVLLCLYDRADGDSQRLLILAGMMTGLAAWTKNEGLLILLAVVTARLVAVVISQGLKIYFKQMIYFAIGAAPILLVVIFFKAAIAPANDLVAGQSLSATAERVFDLSRYVLILKAFVNQLTGFRKWYLHPSYLLIIYAWLVGVKTAKTERTSLVTLVGTLGLILTGYLSTYVTTPRDLYWHLTFSLDRLLIQLWPSLVLLYFFVVVPPETALALGTTDFRSRGVSGFPLTRAAKTIF
jgi:hypothetical protein